MTSHVSIITGMCKGLGVGIEPYDMGNITIILLIMRSLYLNLNYPVLGNNKWESNGLNPFLIKLCALCTE